MVVVARNNPEYLGGFDEINNEASENKRRRRNLLRLPDIKNVRIA
jgi:hypothetical protein